MTTTHLKKSWNGQMNNYREDIQFLYQKERERENKQDTQYKNIKN